MKNANPVIWTVAAIAALSIPLTISISNAQDPGARTQPGQAAPPPGQFRGPGQGQPGQPQPGQFPGPGGQARPMGPGGGGGVTMAIDGAFIYVVQGNRIMKISKDDLKVSKSAELTPMAPPGGAIRGTDSSDKSE